MFTGVGASSKEPAFGDIGKLQIVEAVLKESLRIYPTAPFILRMTGKEMKVGGSGEYGPPVVVPVGTDVYISVYALHRDERFWERYYQGC